MSAAALAHTYGLFITRFIKVRLNYRTAMWLDLAFNMLFLMMQVYLWKALLGAGAVAGASFDDMVTYLLVGRVVSSCVGSRAATRIESRLQSGDIAIDLTRPMSFRVQTLLSDIGAALSRLVMEAVPLLILASLWLGFRPPPSISACLLFLALLAGGALVSFYISYLIGLVGFYVIKAHYLEWLVQTIWRFMAGTVVPFWFYPDWLRRIAELMPFKLTHFVPVSAYMGRLAAGDVIPAPLTLACWAAGLAVLEWWLWRKTVQRLIVQGG